jgi:hypothetical protein
MIFSIRKNKAKGFYSFFIFSRGYLELHVSELPNSLSLFVIDLSNYAPYIINFRIAIAEKVV